MIDASVSDTPFLALGRSADGHIQTRGMSSCLLEQPLDFGRETPDGVFVEWRWDGSTLLVRNDRAGSHGFGQDEQV
jgi:hypothetical protein